MTDATTHEPTLSRGAGWRVAVVATLAMSVSYLDRQALAALAPTVTKELDLTDAQYGWLSSAFSMAYLVGSPAAGIVLDRLGARRGLAIGRGRSNAGGGTADS